MHGCVGGAREGTECAAAEVLKRGQAGDAWEGPGRGGTTRRRRCGRGEGEVHMEVMSWCWGRQGWKRECALMQSSSRSRLNASSLDNFSQGLYFRAFTNPCFPLRCHRSWPTRVMSWAGCRV